MNFSFMTALAILFERGAHKRLGEIVAPMGKRALVLHGASLAEEIKNALTASLDKNGVEFVLLQNPSGEPEAEYVDKAVDAFCANNCDVIVAIGGGSVIDTAKAASGLVTNGGVLKDYLEGVGIGKKIVNDPVPFVAMPTTHGTGAEVTKNAVIGSAAQHFKKSIRDDRLLPDKVIVDAELMVSLPQKATANCSLDALTQLIEAYTSSKANAMTDALCISGLEAAARSIYTAYDHGGNLDAREDMAYASLMSGICLANAGLGAVHGIAPALGITYGISHGESCALMLDHVMEYNLPYAVKKYARIGRILTGKDIADDDEAALAAVEYVRALKAHMGIAKDLKHFGISEADIDVLVSRCSSNSMNANPVKLDKAEVAELIRKRI